MSAKEMLALIEELAQLKKNLKPYITIEELRELLADWYQMKCDKRKLCIKKYVDGHGRCGVLSCEQCAIINITKAASAVAKKRGKK